MYCRYCGKEIEGNSMFCRFCGKPQQAGQTAPAAAAPLTPVAPAPMATAEIRLEVIDKKVWPRGYDQRFSAVRTVPRPEQEVDRSEVWRNPVTRSSSIIPPPVFAPARLPVSALVVRLVHDGWVGMNNGPEWWQTTFQRRADAMRDWGGMAGPEREGPGARVTSPVAIEDPRLWLAGPEEVIKDEFNIRLVGRGLGFSFGVVDARNKWTAAEGDLTVALTVGSNYGADDDAMEQARKHAALWATLRLTREHFRWRGDSLLYKYEQLLPPLFVEPAEKTFYLNLWFQPVGGKRIYKSGP